MKNSFENLKAAIDYLKRLGFVDEYYEYINSSITYVSMRKGEKDIDIRCTEKEDYEKWIMSLPEGTEYTLNTERCDVLGFITRNTELVYPDCSYWGDGKTGIIIENSVTLLEKIFELWENKSKVVKEAYLNHFKNMDDFLDENREKFKEVGLIETYNSITDPYTANSSNPTVHFDFEDSAVGFPTIYVWTDILTGKLCGNVEDVDECIKKGLEIQRLRRKAQ